ncbi:MAG TPA: hypothetical protein VFK20_00965 [Vicinamibacterales bacterium]|nr:hypothetical protein [Vicinamibacterales bacterium]
MRLRTRAALLALMLLAAGVASGCDGRLLGRQYEYEEDLTLALDGSATLVVNASSAALAALRGIDAGAIGDGARIDREKVRAAFTSPYAEVTRVSRPWRRNGRPFVQIRLRVPDVRQLSKAPAFSWSTYALQQQDDHYEFTQTVGRSAFKPGTLPKVGWDGSELVVFRLHLPSRIQYHNARDVDTNETLSVERGNILIWEQHLADRLDGAPIHIDVRMDSQSILYRTLWLFALAFIAAVMVIGGLIWWTVRKGAKAPTMPSA